MQAIVGIMIGFLGAGGIAIIVGGIRQKRIIKKLSFICAGVLALLGSIGMYSMETMTLQEKVYFEYTSYFKTHKNPANELNSADYSDVMDYTTEFNKLNDEYDKEAGEYVANKYNITVDQAEYMYVDEFTNKHK